MPTLIARLPVEPIVQEFMKEKQVREERWVISSWR
jgi:hypothetical protein